ncbi:hypothetical protein [Streptacidiphilus sp. PAMC 29251]
MAAKKTTTTGTAKRIAAAKKRAAVANRHIGRRGGTKTRTVNAPKPW